MLWVGGRIPGHPWLGQAFGLPCFHALFPGRLPRRYLRKFLSSGPIAPACNRKTLRSYAALSSLYSRGFFVLAHFAVLALAAIRRARTQLCFAWPAWVVPL